MFWDCMGKDMQFWNMVRSYYFFPSAICAHPILPRLFAERLEALRMGFGPIFSEDAPGALGWGLRCSGLYCKIMRLISKGNRWAKGDAFAEPLLEISKRPWKIAPCPLLFFTGWISFRPLSIPRRTLTGRREANGAFLTTADEKVHCP